MITDFSGDAPPEKNKPAVSIKKKQSAHSNDVRTRSKKTKIKQFTPAPIIHREKTLDIPLLTLGIFKLAKEGLDKSVDIKAATTLIKEAEQKYDSQNTQVSAIELADKFRFPSNIGDRDVVACIQDIHASAIANRLNLTLIKQQIPASDPDYHAL